MNIGPTASQRESRDEAIRISEGDPTGLKIGSFVSEDTRVPADADGGRYLALASANARATRPCALRLVTRLRFFPAVSEDAHRS